MKGWMVLWQVVFFGGCSLFFGLGVVVSVGGFRDLLDLFRELRRQHREMGEDEP